MGKSIIKDSGMTIFSLPIELEEYVPKRIPDYKISRETGKRLWQEFGSKISVSEPSFKNEDQWEFTSQGWVGYLPFADDLQFYLKPKVPLKNLFGMWEYAYRLKSFEFLQDLYGCESLQEFYEQLASVLTKRVVDRGKKGYYRAYLSRIEDLSYLRGRLDIRNLMNKPWEPRPKCNYQENTTDVEENQLLAWTVYAILRSGFCTERVLPAVRNCYRNIAHVTTVQPFLPSDCVGRLYNRLNQDYQPLHALCRFFLENSGPSYEAGDHNMLPFLVNMASLFELFVAEWLKSHLPPEYELTSQEHLEIGEKGEILFKIDLVIYDVVSRKPIFVLDTKYKDTVRPSPDDIAQVGFYALAKDCNEAVLVYPGVLAQPMNETINDIRIRTSTFSLAGDLEQAGIAFLSDLLKPKLLLQRSGE